MITTLRLRNLIIATLLTAVMLAAAACGQDTETVENTDAAGSNGEPAAPVAEVSNLPKAPEFTLPSANKGTEISLSQFQGGQPVVLVFYRAYW